MAAIYPQIIAIKIGITLKNFRKQTLPIIATPMVTANTIMFAGSMTLSSKPALLAAELDNSKPINATTGPMAALGRTISIHFVPTL